MAGVGGDALGGATDLGAGSVSGAAGSSPFSSLGGIGDIFGGGGSTGGFFDPTGGAGFGGDPFSSAFGDPASMTGGLGGDVFGNQNTFDPASGQTVSPAENLGQQQSIPQGTSGLYDQASPQQMQAAQGGGGVTSIAEQLGAPPAGPTASITQNNPFAEFNQSTQVAPNAMSTLPGDNPFTSGSSPVPYSAQSAQQLTQQPESQFLADQGFPTGTVSAPAGNLSAANMPSSGVLQPGAYGGNIPFATNVTPGGGATTLPGAAETDLGAGPTPGAPAFQPGGDLGAGSGYNYNTQFDPSSGELANTTPAAWTGPTTGTEDAQPASSAGGGGAQGGPPERPGAPGVTRGQQLQQGQSINGWTYNGGNPNDPSNWTNAQGQRGQATQGAGRGGTQGIQNFVSNLLRMFGVNASPAAMQQVMSQLPQILQQMGLPPQAAQQIAQALGNAAPAMTGGTAPPGAPEDMPNWSPGQPQFPASLPPQIGPGVPSASASPPAPTSSVGGYSQRDAGISSIPELNQGYASYPNTSFTGAPPLGHRPDDVTWAQSHGNVVPFSGGNMNTTRTQGSNPVTNVLAQIRQRESGGNYKLRPEQNYAYPRSHASGAYQIQPGTWRAWTRQSGIGTQYSEAYQAPPAVQDAVAGWALQRYGANSSYTWQASAPAGGYPAVTQVASSQ